MSFTESSSLAKTSDNDAHQHTSDILDSSKFDLKLDKSNILMLGPTGSGECDACPTLCLSVCPITGAFVWNGLLSDITSAPSLVVFERRLKTELFCRCCNAA